jgi:hypothetical protein
MRKHSAVLAAIALLVTTGIASAQNQTPRKYERSSGTAKSSGSVPRNGAALAKTIPTGSAGTGGMRMIHYLPLEDHLHGGDAPRSAR